MTTNFFSGGTTISGAQLASTITNMASLGGIGRQVLEEFGIREIDPNQDYPFEIGDQSMPLYCGALVLQRFIHLDLAMATPGYISTTHYMHYETRSAQKI